ncbi:hypothetical protein GobsT_34890 [Gemmata obscuriglobus]|nr:hypothetical protein GobsT_34890 [Gemmata obscuriglobus]VTS06969.1 unnamed protein product [Gemmata obscuriglobus UQM 2246]
MACDLTTCGPDDLRLAVLNSGENQRGEVRVEHFNTVRANTMRELFPGNRNVFTPLVVRGSFALAVAAHPYQIRQHTARIAQVMWQHCAVPFSTRPARFTSHRKSVAVPKFTESSGREIVNSNRCAVYYQNQIANYGSPHDSSRHRTERVAERLKVKSALLSSDHAFTKTVTVPPDVPGAGVSNLFPEEVSVLPPKSRRVALRGGGDRRGAVTGVTAPRRSLPTGHQRDIRWPLTGHGLAIRWVVAPHKITPFALRSRLAGQTRHIADGGESVDVMRFQDYICVRLSLIGRFPFRAESRCQPLRLVPLRLMFKSPEFPRKGNEGGAMPIGQIGRCVTVRQFVGTCLFFSAIPPVAFVVDVPPVG